MENGKTMLTGKQAVIERLVKIAENNQKNAEKYLHGVQNYEMEHAKNIKDPSDVTMTYALENLETAKRNYDYNTQVKNTLKRVQLELEKYDVGNSNNMYCPVELKGNVLKTKEINGVFVSEYEDVVKYVVASPFVITEKPVKLESDGNHYTIESTRTPLGKFLLDAKVNDEFTMPGTKDIYKVVEIQR